MNRYKSTIKVLLTAVLFYASAIHGENNTAREIISRAMKDELNRNIAKLKIDKLASPFFIQYNLRSGRYLEIRASLGAILFSEENPVRNFKARVLTGSYISNDENFFDFSSLYQNSELYARINLPVENSYDGIRRALWISTDNVFKKAAEQYERKKAAISSRSSSSETENLMDFVQMKPVKLIREEKPFAIDKRAWEETAKAITEVFKEFPGVFNSELRIFFYNTDEFIVNSEGSEIIQPQNLASIQINAYTQAEDGEEIRDQILLYDTDPSGLPDKNEIIKQTRDMCRNMTDLRKAPVFKDTYTGPVLFEDQAAPELFAQRLFRSANGLLAVRKPLASDQNGLSYINRIYGETLENRIEKRIASKDLTIKALPLLAEFNGKNLIGTCQADEEAVSPANELVLVQNGILKNMLSNRTPTLGSKTSSGHQQPLISPWQSSSSLGAGVINIQSENGVDGKKLKQELIQMAKDEGLEYAVIVRKIKAVINGKSPEYNSGFTGNLPKDAMLEKPVYVYKLYVKDGSEELVRSVQLDYPSISSLKHITAISKEQIVYNTLMPSAVNYSPYDQSGVPSSFITPKAVIFEELEVRKEKRDFTPKLPCVSNPLSEK